MQDDPPGRVGRLAGGVLAQDLQVAVAGAVGGRGQVGLDLGPQLEGGRVDDHVDAGQLAQLLELLVGEGGLGRAAPAEHVDLADAARGELLEGVLGDVGARQQLGRAGQDAGQVHRHVAVADHHGLLGREVEAEVAEVGVGVVPAHELGGRVAAGQVLARDAHAPVGARPDGVDDRVVVGAQVRVGQVAAHLDVAVEAELGVVGDLVVDARDRLDLLVVGGDAAAHQAEGRRQAVVHVDLDHQVLLLLQVLGRVEARGPGADHGHAQGRVLRAEAVGLHRPPRGRWARAPTASHAGGGGGD